MSDETPNPEPEIFYTLTATVNGEEVYTQTSQLMEVIEMSLQDAREAASDV